MINRALKASFCLSLRQSSDLQKATHSYQHLSNKTKRVEFEVLWKYNIPFLVKSIDSLPLFKSILSYNPALTNGGFDFQQFPLIKILHIGLKLIEDNNQDRSIWSKFQNILRIRLHRCSTDQNMKLLSIMLSTWPFYRFKTDFITSICLGLKKEIDIMNDEQLRVLFRIVTTRWDQSQRFQGNILIQLEKMIFRKVISRWEERLKNIKNRQLLMDSLYMWMNLSMTLSLRNDRENIKINRNSIKLAELFTQIYQKAISENVVPRLPQKEHYVISLNLLSIFTPVLPYYLCQQHNKNEGTNWALEFVKLKGSILSHGRRSIEREIKEINNINTLKWIISLIDIKTLENLLSSEEGLQSIEDISDTKYPKVSKLIDDIIKREQSISDKISFLSELVKNNFISWERAQLYYQSLPLSQLTELTLQNSLYLLQLQLIFYSGSKIFKPDPHIQTLLLNFIEKNDLSFRNFDWLAFHYLRLSYLTDKNPTESSQTSVKLLNQLQDESLFGKLINKILSEVRQADASKLVQQQKKIYLNNPNIVSLKKFFIEVRLHEMNILEPIISYFQRLPHFSNQDKKIVINAYSKEQINSHAVLLQKKLLNDLGWKVINLQLPDFLHFTLSQRVEAIGTGIKNEELLLRMEEKKKVMLE